MRSIWRTVVLELALCGSVVACNHDSVTSTTTTPTPPTQTTQTAQALGSISPTGVVAGSPDLTLTLNGSGFTSGRLKGSRAAWRSGSDTTYLNTTFVNSNQLTAVIPADLLRDAVAAHVYVATGDIMGDLPLAKSNAVAFTVTAPPTHRSSTLPIVFDAGTLAIGQSVTFGKTLFTTDGTCLYWWDYLGFDVAEPCHAYRVTIAAAGQLKASLTWSQSGWMSLSTEDQAGLPTADEPPLRFSRAVQAEQIVVVTVGNHAGDTKKDYTLTLELTR